VITANRRCPARLVRHPGDPCDAAAFKPQVAMDEFVLKYQKPL
jgi:hypothetical protein